MSEWIKEATAETFEELVIQRSHKVPVLVDFWAEWCAPCRQLTPILEQAVNSRDGRVELVKVNVEQAPQLAGEMGVSGIPDVRAFTQGKQRAEFKGVAPLSQINQLLDAIIPPENLGVLRQAEHKFRSGDNEGALERASTIFDDKDPVIANEARLLAAQANLKLGQYEAAREAIKPTREREEYRSQVDLLMTRIDLAEASQGKDVAHWQAQVDADASAANRWGLAGALISENQYEPAFDALLEIVKTDRDFREDGARLAIVALCEDRDVDQDLARSTRRMLQIYL